MKLFTLPGANFTRVAYLDPHRLLTADYYGGNDGLRVWSLVSDAPPQPVPWAQATALWHLFRPGGEALVRRHGLWPTFKRHADTLALSADGRRMAAGSRDGTVRVWDVPGGDELAQYWGVGAIRQVAFSPDGTTAAAAAEKGVVVWDVG